MKLTVVGVSLGLLSAAPALAQSINLDLGIPGTAPPADYRAVGVPGFWNKFEAVDTTITYDLLGLDGQPAGATVRQYGGTEIVSSPLEGPGQPTGAHARLLGDALVTHNTVENCLFFNGLDLGTYEVTSYAWMPNAPATQSSVHIDTNPSVVLVGGDWPGAHKNLVTFARHTIQVTSGFIGPHSGVPSGGDFGIGAALSGIQLRKLTDRPPLFASASELEWLSALSAVSYDTVQGDLATLRATLGDFTAATTGCIANNAPRTNAGYPGDVLAPGAGLFFLVRGNTAQGPLTYDDWGSSQVAPRDAEIAAAAGACN